MSESQNPETVDPTIAARSRMDIGDIRETVAAGLTADDVGDYLLMYGLLGMADDEPQRLRVVRLPLPPTSIDPDDPDNWLRQ